MAATTKLFHCRPKTLPISTFHRPGTSIHCFSSSSSPDFPDYHPSPPPPPPESPSPHSSFISDLKASLKQNQQLRNPQSRPPPHPRKPFSFASSSSSSLPNRPLKASSDEIRKNLQEFRRRTAPPPPPELLKTAGTSPNSAPPTPISFQTLYVRNLAADNNKAEGSSTPDGPQSAANMSFLALKNSLNNLRAANNEGNRNGRQNSQFPRPNLKLWASEPAGKQSPIVIEGTRILPLSGSEMSAAKDDDGKMRTEFFRSYTHKELGEKLRLLRPEKKGDGENWFSLAELNERLAKLREMEVRESKSREVGGVSLFELRESFKKMTDENQKSRVNTMLKIGALDQLGRTPDYMLAPPQEHLVEKYFHPDNMSESEKMKLELTKVRDEFKMSESDCGSARVQVAQLTTKIKHLAKVLHKKDKHSRKGLNDMIQRRKKLLKYMRRTDWDSYCFVLSKLGLRDNPGYNN